MHQEHNIPWNILASNFKYVHEDRRFTPPRNGFIPLHRPTQANELNHFTRKLASTIREFSVTERKKYPPAHELKPPADGILFSNELREKYPEYLNRENQKVDFWIKSVSVDPNNLSPPTYTTSNGGLADVVKILIHENQMEILLVLANHPLIPLHTLKHLSWGHHFGFYRIVEAALVSYIFWNFMAVTDRLASETYRSLETYELVIREVTTTMDYEAQQIPHWEFYGFRDFGNDMPLPTVEPARLREYLKHLFCLFYRYDILLAECGVEPGWESEISHSISCRYNIGLKQKQDAEGRWMYHF